MHFTPRSSVARRNQAFSILLVLLTAAAMLRGGEEDVDFERDIRPIFAGRCHECHSAKNQQAGLRLDARQPALAGGDSGDVLSPGKPDESELLRRVKARDGERMPPEGERLSPLQISLLSRWIKGGADWPADGAARVRSDHWSFQPLTCPDIPPCRLTKGLRQPLDHFIQARLEAAGLPAGAEADRHTLIRRLYLDLVGVSPRPDELAAILADDRNGWYESLVDRLLDSPRFGEKWALPWLDLARYADSDGYEKDLPREHAWRWRDWLIDAVNRDLPLNEFAAEQIAGDLFPHADDQLHLATGFHRNTLTNREGGIDQEEYRHKAVVDRVNTTFTVFMGLTVGCAECHTHKYDPLTQREYYGLLAFFDGAEEVDIPLPLTDEQEEAHFRRLIEHAERARDIEDRLDVALADLKARLPLLEEQLLAGGTNVPGGALEEGLLIHLPLDGNAEDAVGGEAVGRHEGAGEPEWAEGRRGKSLRLYGNSFLRIGKDISFQRDRPFSVSAWIDPDGGGTVISRMDDGNDWRGVDVLAVGGKVLVHLVHKWPLDAVKIETTDTFSEGRWRHLLVTYDGAAEASGIMVYLDGRPQTTTVLVDSLAGDVDTEQPLRIGARKGSVIFRGRIDDVRVYDRELSLDEARALAGDAEILAILKKPAVERTELDRQTVIDYFAARDAASGPLLTELAELEETTPERPPSLGYVMTERREPRTTRIRIRGDFLQPGEEVRPQTPAFLPAIQGGEESPDRLDLARWIVSPENPLFARVAANRIWAELFGQGLVRTPEDFGTQGEPPTHPDLLDYLACGLIELGYSRKQLIRRIVLSAAYRRSSAASGAMIERDPENRLLARQNRFRLPAELVRDQCLAAAGRLNPRVGGKSFRPPLPGDVGNIQFVNQWNADKGEELNRRGIYIHRQRNLMLPMLTTFDHGDAIVACTRRLRSNTPLQSLTLLNGPLFVDAARSLGRELAAMEGTDAARIESAWLRVVCRPPTEEESAQMVRLLARLEKIYNDDPQAAAELLQAAPADGMSPGRAAAWVAVARVLLNLDEAITRE